MVAALVLAAATCNSSRAGLHMEWLEEVKVVVPVGMRVQVYGADYCITLVQAAENRWSMHTKGRDKHERFGWGPR